MAEHEKDDDRNIPISSHFMSIPHNAWLFSAVPFVFPQISAPSEALGMYHHVAHLRLLIAEIPCLHLPLLACLIPDRLTGTKTSQASTDHCAPLHFTFRYNTIVHWEFVPPLLISLPC